ncbi:ferredoxin [Actinomadura sp. NBRC 104425]|uniref:ferredoxin n=1 Tax=Actinomadura sp. NBRC 104425 TaxID=3032204 RepID=UPI0024A1B3FE|nr:ferredoxin [Actinomadura sp. NBRC 104425]GLZ15780.1 ferredoxin [Actinomadura sp. NBRC 104425]
MRIKVDGSLCQGHNRCSALAPDLFVLDDFGFASPAGDGVVPEDRREIALLAVDNCPELAITVEDDDA